MTRWKRSLYAKLCKKISDRPSFNQRKNRIPHPLNILVFTRPARNHSARLSARDPCWRGHDAFHSRTRTDILSIRASRLVNKTSVQLFAAQLFLVQKYARCEYKYVTIFKLWETDLTCCFEALLFTPTTQNHQKRLKVSIVENKLLDNRSDKSPTALLHFSV